MGRHPDLTVKDVTADHPGRVEGSSTPLFLPGHCPPGASAPGQVVSSEHTVFFTGSVPGEEGPQSSPCRA